MSGWPGVTGTQGYVGYSPKERYDLICGIVERDISLRAKICTMRIKNGIVNYVYVENDVLDSNRQLIIEFSLLTKMKRYLTVTGKVEYEDPIRHSANCANYTVSYDITDRDKLLSIITAETLASELTADA